MTQQNINAYQKTQKLAIKPSAAEATALMRAAGFLDEAKGALDDFTAYSKALNFNQTLWTILQADLTSDGNKLSGDMKGDLLNLCAFVDKQTIKALGDPKPEHLDVLIDINRNIAQGLSAQAG